jgi:cell division protein FtsN
MSQSIPPQPKPAAPKKKKTKGRKKTDPFWPIVIILSILAFTGSFWFFYMLTSKINTRTFETTDKPKLMLTPTPYQLEGETRTLDYGPVPTPTPPEAISATPAQNQVVATSSPEASQAPSEAPSALATLAPTPTPFPTRTPRPLPTVAATPTPAPVKNISYRVQVGSYSSRDAAQKAANELSEKGYSAVVSEEGGKFRVQLGVYKEQDGALAIAEEVTQQGYAVVVRKVEL